MKRARWVCSDARRALLILIAWVAVLVGAATSAVAAAEPIAATSARLLAGDEPPRDVTLPLRWPQRAGAPSRLRVEADVVVPTNVEVAPRALYLNFLLDGGIVRVNGQTVATIGETDAQQFVRWKRPWLVELDDGVLRPGLNHIELDLPVPRSGTTVHVPRPVVGPLATLERIAWWRGFWMGTVPMITVAGCLFVGGGALLIWALRRSEELFGLFGLGTLLWGLRSVTYVVESVPAAWWAPFRVYYQTTTAGCVVALAFFSLRFAGLRWPRAERSVVALATVGPLVSALSAGTLDAAVTRWWSPVLLGIGAIMVGAAVHAARTQRSVPAWTMLGAFALCGLVALHDHLLYSTALFDTLLPDWAAQRFLLLHHAANLLLFTMALILVHRFVTTLRAFEELSQSLERRVAAREAELGRNYAELAALQREHAALEERERIMQDLHDGLGSRLFTSLSRVERGALDPTGVAQILRDCIAEMRLALEAQSAEAQDFRTALGNFMFRWEAALRDAGVVPSWQIDASDELLQLAPHDALQLLRVLQEALTNVLKHAAASEVSVVLGSDAGALLLAIEDNGRGLPAQADVRPGGRGLANMQRRAQRLAASLELASAPGRTRIALRMPPRRH